MLEQLRERVATHLTDVAGSGTVDVASIERLAGGACQENFALVARLGGAEKRLVLRSDASTSLPGSLDRAQEHDVIRAATSVGVRTPEARWLARDLVRFGASAYFLDWVDGEAIGRRVVGSPALESARGKLADECAQELAKIHRVTPLTHPTLFDESLSTDVASPPSVTWSTPGADPAQSAIAFARRTLDTLKEPRPAMELALHWLRANAPRGEDRVLVHGDFRTGNFMVKPSGLAAVLDWEFAHWGAAAEDIAWLCVRDWRFGRLKLAAGGFASRAEFYAAYERASGTRVDPREVHWWEVMGNLRWGAASLHQGERYLSGGDSDIELVAVARRAIEMEYEAIRLIERAP